MSDPHDPDDHLDEIDDGDPDEFDDDFECGLRRDGQCGMAGSEYCDFNCPNRESEFFAGSAAWRKKHARKKPETIKDLFGKKSNPNG